jgi:hypothetical protein
MPVSLIVTGAARALVMVVFAAHAVAVWSAVCASSAGVAALEYSANHQFVGVPAAVAPDRNDRLVMTSPACRKIGTEVITPVARATWPVSLAES